MIKLLLIIAAIFGAFGVALSAYVFHGISDYRVYKSLQSVALYSLFNAISILALLAVSHSLALPKLYWSIYGIALGGLLFQSGVMMSTLSLPLRIPIAPIGGVLMITAWLSVGLIAVLTLR